MISQLNSANIRTAYTNDSSQHKEVSKKTTNISSQGDLSSIEKIRESLESGEYKLNIQALSEKIADELL